MSSPGRGSTFVLYLPVTYTPRSSRKALAIEAQSTVAAAASLGGSGVLEAARALPATNVDGELVAPCDLLINEVGDDRDDIEPGDKVLLIIENDVGFAKFLLGAAREKGFKGLVTSLGAAALALTREFKPDAITLDIYLPDIAGWRVLERLKNDVATRHVPVCVVSTDESRDRALASGALAFLTKPIQSRDVLDALLDHVGDFIGRSMKSLLVVEPDPDRRNRILDCIDADEVQVTAVPDAAAALQMLRERRTDCVIAGDKVPDLATTLLAAGESTEPAVGRLPILVFGDGPQHDEDSGDWKRLAETCTINRVHSRERLLDLASFFLHLPVANLPENQRHLLLDLHHSDKLLSGKKVLIVDDDMRNIFALSTVLEEHDMVISSADNGRDAIRILQSDPAIDIVLMDIMMPEMDGLETMREIRKIPEFKNLPIVAVTAKAMKGDREKCIEAGRGITFPSPSIRIRCWQCCGRGCIVKRGEW